MHLKII